MKLTGILVGLLALSLPPMALAKPPSEHTPAEVLTDKLLFQLSLDEFVKVRDGPNRPDLDWSTDACSHAADNPLGFQFKPACWRHDFGYGNYKAQNRFDWAAKHMIDLNFYWDCRNQCPTTFFVSAVCELTADAYFGAIKIFGGSQGAHDKRDAEAVREYEENLAFYEKSVARYNALIDEGIANGTLVAAANGTLRVL